MLSTRSGLVAASILSAGGLAALNLTTDAHSKGGFHGALAPRCEVRVEGSGTGQGVFGAGSRKARATAIANFQQTAALRFGQPYASFDRAREVRWDCRSGVLEARCIVTAVPCR